MHAAAGDFGFKVLAFEAGMEAQEASCEVSHSQVRQACCIGHLLLQSVDGVTQHEGAGSYRQNLRLALVQLRA
eukprot:12930877-Prorocentrum_lima.AAC.1